MNSTVHPPYVTATVVCACGNAWETRATKPLLRVEACNLCHPVFLRGERRVQTTGQMERFRHRYGFGQALH